MDIELRTPHPSELRSLARTLAAWQVDDGSGGEENGTRRGLRIGPVGPTQHGVVEAPGGRRRVDGPGRRPRQGGEEDAVPMHGDRVVRGSESPLEGHLDRRGGAGEGRHGRRADQDRDGRRVGGHPFAEAVSLGITSVPVLSDPDLKVSASYDVLQWAIENGEPSHTFVLVDGDGKIAWVKDYGAPDNPNRTMYVEIDELVTYVRDSLEN